MRDHGKHDLRTGRSPSRRSTTGSARGAPRAHPPRQGPRARGRRRGHRPPRAPHGEGPARGRRRGDGAHPGAAAGGAAAEAVRPLRPARPRRAPPAPAPAMAPALRRARPRITPLRARPRGEAGIEAGGRGCTPAGRRSVRPGPPPLGSRAPHAEPHERHRRRLPSRAVRGPTRSAPGDTPRPRRRRGSSPQGGQRRHVRGPRSERAPEAGAPAANISASAHRPAGSV